MSNANFQGSLLIYVNLSGYFSMLVISVAPT